jgi:protein SERAC1
MANGSSSDQMNLEAIYGILFFGVPSQGMNIESLIAMVGDQPNRYLLESLGKESDLLQEQRLHFPEAFPFRDSEIICFYETMKSPTAHYVGLPFHLPISLNEIFTGWPKMDDDRNT